MRGDLRNAHGHEARRQGERGAAIRRGLQIWAAARDAGGDRGGAEEAQAGGEQLECAPAEQAESGPAQSREPQIAGSGETQYREDARRVHRHASAIHGPGWKDGARAVVVPTSMHDRQDIGSGSGTYETI